MFSYIKITTWAVMWLILFMIFMIFRQGRDNCLTWALRKFDSDDGYLVIRWCRSSTITWFRWPHFLWLDKNHHAQLTHYVPQESKQGKFFPQPWFRGKIKQGDDPNDNDEN